VHRALDDQRADVSDGLLRRELGAVVAAEGSGGECGGVAGPADSLAEVLVQRGGVGLTRKLPRDLGRGAWGSGGGEEPHERGALHPAAGGPIAEVGVIRRQRGWAWVAGGSAHRSRLRR